MSGLFSYLTGSIDSALNTFVVDVSSNLATAITPVVAAGLTIWITMYGYAVMRHEVSEPISVFVKEIVMKGLILLFALGSGQYQSEVVGGVNALTSGLIQVVSPAEATGVFEALDQLHQIGGDVAGEIIARGSALLPIGGYTDLISGFLMLAGVAALLLILGGITIVAKAALTIVLAFGPLFIACLAFKPVAHFFQSWMSKVANYVMLMVLMATVAGLATRLASNFLKATEAALDTSNGIQDTFAFLLLVGVLILLCKVMPSIAAALTGGASLVGTSLFGTGAGGTAAKPGAGGSLESRASDGGNTSIPSAAGSITPGQLASGKSRVSLARQATRANLNKRR